ncbi:hypothetical protein [Methylobacterium organophilum]|uniref:Uncharacterized protein n=1 Tax=Methylobacterium organophilum TaxID=410 RepID=A0ABQ4T7L3_METOR|nr:hypothetical protein [Methylobacterium organophilum]GJE26256.1 hypothetical protein LKMONMHP_1105 [Methylobacterium organophilum]
MLTLLRIAASALRCIAMPLLWIGWLATPVLWGSSWCEDKAREWDPRIWDRTGGRTPTEARD